MINLDDLRIGSMIRWDWGKGKSRNMYGVLTRIHKRDKHRDEYVMHLFNGEKDFQMMFYKDQLESTTATLTMVKQ
tara:strand:- start:667 stop:891 length:225 start_codon:yes stop_codon:yes gene_type:complete